MRIKIPLHLAHSRLDQLLQEGLEVGGKDFLKNTLPAQEWVKKVEGEIMEIFEDAEPVYRLSRLSMKPKVATSSASNPLVEMAYFFDELRHKMSILAELYKEVEERLITPLEYVDKMCCLRFRDSICQLQPNSIQRSLCKYLFSTHDFGELIDNDLVAQHVLLNPETGRIGEPSTKDIKSVRNAAEEVNKKTIIAFGFSIINCPQGSIGLVNPSRLVSAET